MKIYFKIFFLLSFCLCVCMVASCSNDDDPSNNRGALSPDVPKGTFYQDLDGLWYCDGRTMSASEFNENIKGSAWLEVEYRYINSDGSYGAKHPGLNNTEYGHEDNIWLFGEGELTRFVSPDAHPFRYHWTVPYEISDPVGYLKTDPWKILPIGMIDEDHLEIIFSTTSPATYFVLERLSKEEQSLLYTKYPYDYYDLFDEDGNRKK